eukprot:g15573.t1
MENLMQRFPEKKYDVTNYIESGCLLCCSTQKRPYAQLGSVELHDSCCGLCVGMSSNLEKVNEKGEGGIRPFFGIDRPYTEDWAQLSLSTTHLGDTAQRKQQTFLMEQITKLTAQLPLVMSKRGIAWPPSDSILSKLFPQGAPSVKTFKELYSPPQEPTFDTQSWDVVCCCELLTLG